MKQPKQETMRLLEAATFTEQPPETANDQQATAQESKREKKRDER